jgi:ESX secretion system ATPase EccB
MLTRKDLLQAHRLGTQRAGLALISGEPDDPERPLRRMSVATFASIMVAVLIGAGFGVFGLVRPGGATGLQEPGMLIVVKESGARYIWCEQNKLCPVTNYASARLLAGADDKHRRTVSRNSIADFPRGPLIGIPGAPDTVPEPDNLVATPWSVCVRSSQDETAGAVSSVTLQVGRGVGGQQIGEGQAALVQTASQGSGPQAWLIWRNKRMQVPSYALATLNATPAPVSPAWINAIPLGPAFAAPNIPGLGKEVNGPQLSGRVGELYKLETASGTGYYVLLEDGLAQVTQIQKELLLANPLIKQEAYLNGQVQEKLIDAASTLTQNRSSQQLLNEDLNGKPPSTVSYDGTNPLCVVYDDPKGNLPPKLTLGGSLSTAARSGAGGVNLVFDPPGGAAVAGLVPGPGRADSVTTFFLVTEGRRFALASPDAAKSLGYQLPQDAAPVPADVLGLIPLGPALDPAVAQRSVGSAATAPPNVAPSAPSSGTSSGPSVQPTN